MPEDDSFSLDAGILSIRKDLDEIAPDKFEEALDRLVTGDAAAPVLDLGELRYLPSRRVADIHSAADRCIHGGKSLTIRAKQNVAIMLERMGLGAVARVKSV